MRLANKQGTILHNEEKNQSTDTKPGWKKKKQLDSLKINNFFCMNQNAEVIGQTTTLNLGRELYLHVYYHDIYQGGVIQNMNTKQGNSNCQIKFEV